MSRHLIATSKVWLFQYLGRLSLVWETVSLPANRVSQTSSQPVSWKHISESTGMITPSWLMPYCLHLSCSEDKEIIIKSEWCENSLISSCFLRTKLIVLLRFSPARWSVSSRIWAEAGGQTSPTPGAVIFHPSLWTSDRSGRGSPSM